MIQLPRPLLKAIVPGPMQRILRSDIILQEQLGGCPWRIMVASMLLCRTRRVQAEPVFLSLLRAYPEAESLAVADQGIVESIVRPCGLHRNRARQLTRASCLWLSDSWSDLRDLPGVGVYVADAVGLVCFGCTDLESNDHALKEACRAREATLST